MNRQTFTWSIAMLLGAGITAHAVETKIPATKKQTASPVMGGKINKAQYADVKGKRIYVCCPGCINKIKNDPDKYIRQMEAVGIVIDKTPKKDNHSGHHNDHSGHRH